MRWLCVCIVTGLTNTFTAAQTHPRTAAFIEQASGTMCKCINDALLTVDNEVQELVMYALTDSIAGTQRIQLYLENSTQERATEVIQQLQQFGAIDSEMNYCIESASDIHKLDFEMQDLTSAEQAMIHIDLQDNHKTIEQLLNYMQLLEGCEFAHQFIRFGVELEKK